MKRCSTCRWFKLLDQTTIFGQCYYLPPVAVLDINGELCGLRPYVEADDKACSKWTEAR